MFYKSVLSVMMGFVLMGCSPDNSASVDKKVVASTPAAGLEPVLPSTTVALNTEEKILNFSSWPDYIPETMIQDFEKETGIKVNFTTYTGNEELESRMKTKTDIFDLVVPGINYGPSQIEKGYYQPLNKSLLPHYKNLDPEFLKSMSLSDPGNKYFVPWAWGYVTLFVNKTRVKKALGDLPFPEKEFDLVFNPTYTQRLKSCGIAYLDSPSDIIPLALHHMGLNPYSNSEEDYKKASSMLKLVRNDIGVFSSTMIDALSADTSCVGIAWSGDINTAIAEIRKNGSKDELVGLQVKQGTLLGLDGLAIPVNAKQPRNAHAFIDFYLKATNSARMPNEISFPNGNLAALEFVQPDIKSNPLIFLPPEYFAKLVPTNGFSNSARWSMMQEYVSFAHKLEFK